MTRIDFDVHFVTQESVKALEASRGHPRGSVEGQMSSCRLQYTDDVGEPLGDALLDKLLDTGGQR